MNKIKQLHKNAIPRSPVPKIGVLKEYEMMLGNGVMEGMVKELEDNEETANESKENTKEEKKHIVEKKEESKKCEDASDDDRYSIFKKPRPRDIIYGKKLHKKKKEKKMYFEEEFDENDDKNKSQNLINVQLTRMSPTTGKTVPLNSFIEEFKRKEKCDWMKVSSSSMNKIKSRPSSESKYNMNSINSYNPHGEKAYKNSKRREVLHKYKDELKFVHYPNTLSETNSLRNDSIYNKSTLNTPISINNAFKVRTQPRVYRSLKATREIPIKSCTNKNTPVKNKKSVGFISKSFKEYLRNNNIPIVRNRDENFSGLISPCNQMKSNLMTDNSLFSTNISNAEEICNLQKNMICSSIPSFCNNSSAALHRITMRHMNSELDKSYKQTISNFI